MSNANPRPGATVPVEMFLNDPQLAAYCVASPYHLPPDAALCLCNVREQYSKFPPSTAVVLTDPEWVGAPLRLDGKQCEIGSGEGPPGLRWVDRSECANRGLDPSSGEQIIGVTVVRSYYDARGRCVAQCTLNDEKGPTRMRGLVPVLTLFRVEPTATGEDRVPRMKAYWGIDRDGRDRHCYVTFDGRGKRITMETPDSMAFYAGPPGAEVMRTRMLDATRHEGIEREWYAGPPGHAYLTTQRMDDGAWKYYEGNVPCKVVLHRQWKDGVLTTFADDGSRVLRREPCDRPPKPAHAPYTREPPQHLPYREEVYARMFHGAGVSDLIVGSQVSIVPASAVGVDDGGAGLLLGIAAAEGTCTVRVDDGTVVTVDESRLRTVKGCAPGARVELCHLRARPELNGVSATVLASNKDRWAVALDTTADAVSVRAENLRLVRCLSVDDAVRCEGLVSRPALNHQPAKLGAWNDERRRWEVRIPLGGGRTETVFVRADKLLTEEEFQARRRGRKAETRRRRQKERKHVDSPPPESPRRVVAPTSTERLPLGAMVLCPLSGQPMVDAVLAADGYVYSEAALLEVLRDQPSRSPITGAPMGADHVAHYTFRSAAHDVVSTGAACDAEQFLCCSITCEPMVAPVLASDGFVYENDAIEVWVARSWREKGQGALSPMTNLGPLASTFREDKTMTAFCAAWRA